MNLVFDISRYTIYFKIRFSDINLFYLEIFLSSVTHFQRIRGNPKNDFTSLLREILSKKKYSKIIVYIDCLLFVIFKKVKFDIHLNAKAAMLNAKLRYFSSLSVFTIKCPVGLYFLYCYWSINLYLEFASTIYIWENFIVFALMTVYWLIPYFNCL